MVVNRANLDALFQTYNAAFTAAQKRASERAYPNALTATDVALLLPTTGAGTVHGWLEQIKSIHEWVGDRLVRNLTVNKLSVSNRDFENTIAVSRNDIEDDQYGMFTPLIGMMGEDAESLWQMLAVEALLGNGTWADGNSFFCSGRKLGDSTITNAVTTALSRAAVEAGLTAMRGWMLHGGAPADVRPECLVVGPALEGLAKQIVEADLVSDGTSNNAVTISNVSTARMLKVRVDARITGNEWYVTGRKGGIPAICVQQRLRPTLTRLDRDTDENVFMRNEYLYGTHARGESFLTLPFLAYAGGQSSVDSWSAA